MVMYNSKNEKIMKKIILSIMAVSALFACQKEIPVETPQAETVTFKAFVDGADTKTVLNETTKYSEWAAGDKITIHNETKGFEFTTSEAGPSADFSYTGGGFSGNKFLAVYPSGNYTVNLAEKTVNAYIPTWQQAQVGTYHGNAALAVAYSESNAFAFKNATALLKFTVNADNVTHMVFHGNDSEALTGNVKVVLGGNGVDVTCLDTEFTTGEGDEQVKETKKGTWVEMYAYHDADNRYFEKGKTYYVAVAPAALTKGATVKFRINEGEETVVKTTDKNITIEPNTIYNLGELKYEAPVVHPWAVSGAFNGWAQGADLEPMEQSGDYYVIKNVDKLDFYAGEDEGEDNDHGFKFIENGKDWRGGKGEVEAGKWDWVYDNDGQNIHVKNAAETDKFDIYLNPTTRKYVIVEAGTAMPEDKEDDPVTLDWAIVGSMPESAWNNNIAMTLEGDWRVAKNVDIRPSDEFKFRVGTGWDKMVTYNESAVVAGTEYTTVDGTGMAKGITVSASAKYDVYLYKDASKFKLIKKGDLAAKDYSQCVIEIVGAGVADQTGATKETIWNWGNSMLASNNGKPSVSGNTYTWTWTGIQLANAGCKIRTKDAKESGGIANFDCGASAVDKSNSVAVTTDNDGNIIVAAGKYNITFTIDAAADTKKIVIKAAN